MRRKTKGARSLALLLTCMFLVMTFLPPYASAAQGKEEAGAAAAQGTDYYLDSENGNDGSDGTGPSSAWRTLDKLKEVSFQPGDRILFHSGSVFNGAFAPKGSGTEEAPITVDIYNGSSVGSDAGERAILNGEGLVKNTVFLENLEYWTINNLEITNTGATREARAGVMVEINQKGVFDGIHLNNLFVHDVNGDIRNKSDNGGIYFINRFPGTLDGTETSRYNDISVENCHIKDVSRTGLSVGWFLNSDFIEDEYGRNGGRVEGKVPQLIERFYNTNVVIRNNYVENAGGDAIVPMYALNPLIEYNISNRACKDMPEAGNQYSAAIWPWRCINAVFQFNEAYDSVINGDGQAYDCDWSVGTTYQYNYSHDNEGGFMLVCQSQVLDSVIRYNISQNDLRSIFMLSNTNLAEAYNNTIYVKPGVEIYANYSGKLNLRNNIFYSAAEGERTANWSRNGAYDHNLYYGFSNLPEDANKVVADPKFVDPGKGIDGVPGNRGIDSLGGYQLQDDSPAINAGAEIEDNGGRDYFGNPVGANTPDIGAFESSRPEAILYSDDYLIDQKSGEIILTEDSVSYEAFCNKVRMNQGAALSVCRQDGSPVTGGLLEAGMKAVVSCEGAEKAYMISYLPKAFSFAEDFKPGVQGPVWYAQYRQNGVVSNFTQFVEDWNCWTYGAATIGMENNMGLIAPTTGIDALYSWIAPKAGTVELSARELIALRRQQLTSGKMSVSLWKNDEKIYPQSEAAFVETQGNFYLHPVTIEVEKGDRISFSMEFVAGISDSSAYYSPVVRYVEGEADAFSNISKDARATASSCAEGYSADGLLDLNNSLQKPGLEWKAAGNQNEWAQLSWSCTQEINEVVLLPDAAGEAKIRKASLVFSNGTRMDVSLYLTADMPAVIQVEPQLATWVRLEVEEAEGAASLGDFQVFGSMRVTRNELQALYNQGETYLSKQNRYAEDGWNAYFGQMQTAREILEERETDSKRLNESYSGLKDALSGLQEKSMTSFVKEARENGAYWLGRFGSEGYAMFSHAENGKDVLNLPDYVEGFEVDADTWYDDTADTDYALSAPDGSKHSGVGMYFGSSKIPISITTKDEKTEPYYLTLYLTDFDNGKRSQQIKIMDKATGTVLCTSPQTITSFQGGVYQTYRVQGDVIVQVNSTVAQNCVIQGLFFDKAEKINDPSLQSPVASFDKNTSKEDIQTTIQDLGALIVEELQYGENTLLAGTDYLAEDDQITLCSSFLATLPVGLERIDVVMSDGSRCAWIVNVSETADKTSLRTLYLQNQNRDEESYTAASWTAFRAAMDHAKAVLDDGNGTQTEINKAEEALRAAIDALVNRGTLKIVLDLANAHVTAGDVDKLIPTAKEQFHKALASAQGIYDSPEATQEQVDNAWKTLMNVIHALGFVPGDKSELINLVAEAKGIALEGYEDGAEKDAFTAALQAAEDLIADKDAMKLDIDAAYQALDDAMQNLIPKPATGDKTELKKVIDEANVKNGQLDKYVYDAAAKKAFADALQAANDMYAKDGATQDEIDGAKLDLLTAMAGLRLRADKSSLNDWLDELKGIDLTAYTAESADVVRAVISRAEALAAQDLGEDDMELIQAMVAEMENAKAQLEKAPAEPEDPENPDESSKPDDTSKPDDSKPDEENASKEESSSEGKDAADKAPATGDSLPAALLSVMALASAGAWLLSKRKK